MNYHKIVFERSFGTSEQLPASDMPEIAFAGRSNVGKSSMINKVFNRKQLARVSAVPGKTATINFFQADGIRFADLPGYGYARVSKGEKRRWAELIEGYFNQDRDLRLVFQLIDMRHPPTGDDLTMVDFLIDREKYLQRKDLIYTGRTLFGAMPPKGQEMDDHYYGVIRERIGSFMKELNEELWKLGVTAKTQHNEVAPAQHELATIYAKANLAVDHNQLVMETMKKVASRHGLACLLHEKPFQGVNGSGKHNNWSLTSDTGVNMLDPGITPHENVQFLLVLACTMKAVDIHADLLRQSAAVPGNDLRLGAQEAPPAIISIFVGEQLEDVIDQLCSTGSATHSITGGTFKTGVTTLPDFDKDATDRNRTSPFAFTGNKFEFRMVGSSDSVSSANVVLNTIVAEAFKEAADELEKAEDFDMAVHNMIKKLFMEHRRIIFNGNGYTEEWVKEAERRGLPNLKCMVDAIPALVTEKAIKLFGDFGVYTRAELEARAEIEYESYAKSVNVEAKTMIDMAGKQIIPAVIKYTTVLAQSLSAVQTACPDADVSVQTELLLETSDLLSDMKTALSDLQSSVEECSQIRNMEAKAHAYHDEIVPVMDRLRAAADQLEMLVDKEYWPMPSYGDLIFEV